MTLNRTDAFLRTLKKLMREYPEYGQILELLIDEIQKGKMARIHTELERMKNENW